jgi:hypothetical protein
MSRAGWRDTAEPVVEDEDEVKRDESCLYGLARRAARLREHLQRVQGEERDRNDCHRPLRAILEADESRLLRHQPLTLAESVTIC